MSVRCPTNSVPCISSGILRAIASLLARSVLSGFTHSELVNPNWPCQVVFLVLPLVYEFPTQRLCESFSRAVGLTCVQISLKYVTVSDLAGSIRASDHGGQQCI
eukprot:2660374-Amphidinium_carterae.4